ncbi:MAG: flippase-like domain-containing protein [Desulfurococcales archaeon]|nr:flippase-like domain-containing protein [Desulfurococcales archaeon]
MRGATGGGAYRRYLVLGSIALVVFTLIGLRIVVGPLGSVWDIITSIPPGSLIIALAFIVAGEVVRGFRLVIIARLLGIKVPVVGAIVARLLGRWASLLSPASIASTPLRAGVIGAYSGLGVGEATGLSILETIYDLVIPVFLTLIIGVLGFPDTWFLLLVALLVSGLWVLGILFANTPTVEELVLRYTGRREWWCYARRQRLLFLKILRGSLSFWLAASSLALTLVAHLLESIAVGSMVSWSGGVLWWFIVLEVSYAMAMTPMPGGALLSEYGLGSIMSGEDLVRWRTTYILAGLLPGSLLLVLIPSLRRYLEEISKGLGECVEE